MGWCASDLRPGGVCPRLLYPPQAAAAPQDAALSAPAILMLLLLMQNVCVYVPLPRVC